MDSGIAEADRDIQEGSLSAKAQASGADQPDTDRKRKVAPGRLDAW